MKTKSLISVLTDHKMVALAGLTALFFSCGKEKDIDFNPVNLSNIKETRSSEGLVSPSGLSSNDISNLEKSYSLKSYQEGEGLIILAQGPLYSTGFAPLKDPGIYGISENTKSGDFNLTLLVDFPFSKYEHFFNSPKHLAGSDTVARPFGITLETLVLEDGSVLFSSSTYGGMLKINRFLKDISVYMENNELRGITDMLKAGDGKIYAVQVPFISDRDSSIISPKKIISIDDLKNIKIECELPSENSMQRGPGARWYEQLKIIENSEAGKEKFGTQFYVLDMLEDCIYKVDMNKNVEVLARGLRYPTSIAVDSIGDLFYTNSPLWYELGGSEIEYPSEFRMLNPETGESTLLHKFDERDIGEYTSSGAFYYVMYNGEEYVLPTGYNVTSILKETAGKLEFLFTNSHQGTLKSITANKY